MVCVDEGLFLIVEAMAMESPTRHPMASKACLSVTCREPASSNGLRAVFLHGRMIGLDLLLIRLQTQDALRDDPQVKLRLGDRILRRFDASCHLSFSKLR